MFLLNACRLVGWFVFWLVSWLVNWLAGYKTKQAKQPNQTKPNESTPNQTPTNQRTTQQVSWLVGWLVGCLGCSRLGRALVRPGRELVIYGLSFPNNKPHGPHPVMDGPGTCNPRAVSLSWEHTHHNKTQAQQQSNTDFPNTTDKQTRHNKTKQNQTNTTKQDEANQTTKPNQVKQKHAKPNPNKATHNTAQQT